MIVVFRLLVPIAILSLVLYLIRDIELVMGFILWIAMIYLIIGSVSGGVRLVISRFTRRPMAPIHFKLGVSWAALTLWLLRTILGLAPPTASQDGPSDHRPNTESGHRSEDP